MLLLDRHGPKEDVWERAETLCQAETNFVIAPFGAIAGSPFVHSDIRIGALLEPNRTIDEVAPFFDRFDLIVIHFANAADGRGFSTARQLRQAGFKGILRAFGPLISDQFPQALACGFDEVEIIGAAASRQPVEHWMEALSRISHFYQRDYGANDSIPDQRLARAAHV
ncbi:DUF934 domain-containing protein [Rhodoblastus sp.]|uniref:DUF934 domain-containing protein n=1 Tax=Rhodoblastus sp. TaxID=1962975 RepID=UPI003F968165